VWLIAPLAGALCVATGALPWHDAVSTTDRVGPILGFLVAITVVAELADAAHVFDVAAVRAGRIARGHTRRLFALMLIFGAMTTVVLSLDTTAVLLTPVMLALASRLRLAPLPFAMAAVWLANTASLLLPVSNLTNLLAADRLDMSAMSFASRMWLPALVSVALTACVMGFAYRRELRGCYEIPAPLRAPDRALFAVATSVCVVVAPLFVTPIPVWMTATGGALLLVAAFAVRDRRRLRFSLIPWRLVLLVEGLFLFIATLGVHGLDSLLSHLAGHSSSGLGILRTAGVGAAASNVFNNLPSYLALERVADGRTGQVLGLLLGTNLGPLILLWGSLATLLWRERCKARGIHISGWHFAGVGLLGVPVLLFASWASLLVTR
jgi:arsenical pump membrane protein